jgi:2'-5' RNA ligase
VLALPASWVRAENFHLTVKFLGGVDEGKVPALIPALHKAVARHRAFDADVCGLGAFPSVTRPRVLCAGVTTGVDSLRAVARSVDDAMADLGFSREDRELAAHVTLARVREPHRVPALTDALARGATRRFGTISVSSVALVRSDLSPRGARYTVLGEAPLKG